MTPLCKEILFLRAEGKSYKQIKDKLGCSKSTISYYCAWGQKEKSLTRQSESRKKLKENKVKKDILVKKLTQLIKKIDNEK